MPASWREPNLARYSAGRCFSMSARTSASVSSSMTSGMMIGRGNGCAQFGVANSRKCNNWRKYNHAAEGRVELEAVDPGATPSRSSLQEDKSLHDPLRYDF